jgi:hypothetical protein
LGKMDPKITYGTKRNFSTLAQIDRDWCTNGGTFRN